MYNDDYCISNFLSPERVAIVVIDAQTIFCSNDPMMWGNDHTHRAAEEIARTLPFFREAGISIYIVTYKPKPLNIPFHELYLIQPGQSDTLIEKHGRSAFNGTALQSLLDQRNHDSLILCGFDQSVCVYETAIDAIEARRSVLILRNLTADGKALAAETRKRCLTELDHRGVGFTTSSALLKEQFQYAGLLRPPGSEPSTENRTLPSLHP